METLISIIVRNRWVVLGIVLIAAGAAIPLTGDALEPNNALEVWFLEDDPALRSYHDFQGRFGNDEIVAVCLHDEGGIFTVENLRLIHDASRRLKERESDWVKGVTSISTVLHIGWGVDEHGDSELVLEKSFRRPPATQAEVDIVRDRIMSDPIYGDHIITKDEKTTLLIIQPQATGNIDRDRPIVLFRIQRVLDEVFYSAGKEVSVGGMGVMYQRLNEISTRDATIFLSFSSLIIFVVLGLTLRRLIPVVTAGIVIAVSLGALLGLYGAFGRQMNMVTMIIPTLLMVYGVADVMHIVTHYYQERLPLERGGVDKRGAVARSVGYSLAPCLFTTLTTAAGFASLSWSKMAVIRDLGIFAAIGVALAFVVSMVVVAVVLDVFDVRPPAGFRPPPAPGRRTRLRGVPDPEPGILGWVADVVYYFPDWVIVFSVIAAVTAGVGIARLEVDTYSIQFLFPTDPVHRDHTKIEGTFGNYTPMEFLIETGTTDGAKDPELLAAIDRFEVGLAKIPNVSKTVAVTSVTKRLNQAFHDGAESEYRIPTDPDVVAQELLWYDPDRADDPQKLVDFPHYTTARVTAKVKNLSAQGWAEVLRQAKEAVDAAGFPDGTVVTPSGYLPLYVRLIDYVVGTQLLSFGIAFGVVFVLIGVVLRSLRLALISIVPNCLPVAVILGAMGFAGIRLDVATVVIAAVMLGIAVDDTVHFLFRFRKELAENGGDHRRAARTAILTTGHALVGTSITLFAGFLIFVLAGIKSIVFFGVLTGCTIIAALLADLMVLPTMLVLIRPRISSAFPDVDPASDTAPIATPPVEG